MSSGSFSIVLSKRLAPDDFVGVVADLVTPGSRIDVCSSWDDLPADPGAISAVVEDTNDPGWPCVLNVLVCRDGCGLGPYPDLRLAVRLWERFGVDSQCGTYPFAGELDPHDPYWSLVCVGGRWYLASTDNTRLMGPYTDGVHKLPGDSPVRLVRPIVIPVAAWSGSAGRSSA